MRSRTLDLTLKRYLEFLIESDPTLRVADLEAAIATLRARQSTDRTTLELEVSPETSSGAHHTASRAGAVRVSASSSARRLRRA